MACWCGKLELSEASWTSAVTYISPTLSNSGGWRRLKLLDRPNISHRGNSQKYVNMEPMDSKYQLIFSSLLINHTQP